MGFGPDRVAAASGPAASSPSASPVLTVIAIVGAVHRRRVLTVRPRSGPDPTGAGCLGDVRPPAGRPSRSRSGRTRSASSTRRNGNRTELDGSKRSSTATRRPAGPPTGTSRPTSAAIKPGMGMLIDLGAPTKVTAVRVTVGLQGASVSLRSRNVRPGQHQRGRPGNHRHLHTAGPGAGGPPRARTWFSRCRRTQQPSSTCWCGSRSCRNAERQVHDHGQRDHRPRVLTQPDAMLPGSGSCGSRPTDRFGRDRPLGGRRRRGSAARPRPR